MKPLYSKLKSVLLPTLAVACLSASVAQATPYATSLTNTAGTVSFRINESGGTVKVIGNQYTLTNNLGVLPVGLTVTNLSSAGGSSIMTGGVFQVVVDKAGTGAPFQVLPTLATTNNQMFESPRAVGVNVRPASPYFGRIYVGNVRVGTTAGFARTVQDGIYVMNADSSDALGQGNTALTGGLDMVSNPAVNIYSFMPWRIRVGANDDMLYLCNWTDTNLPNLYQVSPNVAPGSGVPVFQAFTPSQDPLVPALPPVTSANNHGSVAEVVVTGSQAGGNLKVYSVDEDYQTDPNTATATERNSLWLYDIGAGAFPWSSAPNQKIATPAVGSVSQTMGLDRGSNGYLYLLVSRSAGSETCLQVIDPAGPTVLYSSRPDSIALGLGRDWFSNSCSVAVSPDLKYLAVQRNAGQVLVVPLTNGIPNLPARIEFTGIGASARQLIFDAANNLYLVSNATERMRVWSLGLTATATTTSNPLANGGEGGAFNLNAGAQISVTPAVTQAFEEGLVPAQFTINRALNNSSDMTVSYTLSGTAVSNVDYTITPTSPFVLKAGDSSTNITITPINDSIRESIETVILTLSSGGQAYTVVAPTSATATITDNDSALRYWDIDGANPGAGSTSPTGTWGTDNFWGNSLLGDSATTAWTNWGTAVFSAGFDAFGPFTVTLSSPQLADHFVIEEGDVTFTGSTLTLTNFDANRIGVALTTTMDSVLTGGGGLWLNGEGTLVLGANNTYTGPTLIETGMVRIASSERIPDSSALTLGSGGNLDLNFFNETVGSLAGSAGAVVTVQGGNTLTFGGNNSSTTWNGTINGGFGGALAKVGTGTLTIGGVIADALAISNGVVSFNAPARLGAFNAVTIDNNAVLETTSAVVGADFIGPGKTITLGAGGGTVKVTDPAAILFLRDSSVISGPGTLIKDGPGELRTYNVEHSYGKLFVKAGLYTAGHSTLPAYNTSFGAIPAVLTPDAITLTNGSQIRKAGGYNVILDPNQGITLQTGGGIIRAYSGSLPQDTGAFIIPGPISGVGSLTLNQVNEAAFIPIIVLGTNNTYAGGTVLRAGTLYVTNSAGSATGSGSVSTTNSTLGGDGILGGPVFMSGGNLSPGYNFNTGPQPVTPVFKQTALLRMTNGLTMSASATNVWELTEYSTSNPGVDFDQVELTGGNLVLGGSSVLSLSFSNNAAAPNGSDAFWTSNHEWTIVKVTSPAANPGSTKFTTILNGNYPGIGSFTNYVGTGGSIVLRFVAGSAVPQPVISPAIGGANTGNPVLTWSSVPGASYTVQYATNLAAPVTWHNLTNITGGPGATTAILDNSGYHAQRFYRVVVP